MCQSDPDVFAVHSIEWAERDWDAISSESISETRRRGPAGIAASAKPVLRRYFSMFLRLTEATCCENKTVPYYEPAAKAATWNSLTELSPKSRSSHPLILLGSTYSLPSSCNSFITAVVFSRRFSERISASSACAGLSSSSSAMTCQKPFAWLLRLQ